MRNVFSVVLRLIAFLLAVLAIFATTFVLLFLSFNRILLTSQTYQQALAENKIVEQLPAVMAEEFALLRSRLAEPCAETVIANACLDSNVLQPVEATKTGRLGVEGRAFINGLNEAQWKSLILYVLRPQDVQKSLDAGIVEVIAYFKGEANTAGIPLMDLKTRLTDMTDEDLTELLLKSQPICTPEQQTTVMSGGIGGAGSSPIFCSANDETSQVLLLDLRRRLTILAEELPEQVTIIKFPSPLNAPNLQRIIGKDLQTTLKTLQDNAEYVPFLPVAFLLVVTFFSVRSLRGLLRWWSIPIFVGGLLTLIIGSILFFLFDQIWLNYVLNRFPHLLTSGFGDLIYGVLHSLSKDVSQHLLIQAAITTLLALGILFVSNRVPAPPDPSLPPLAPPGTPGGPVLNPHHKKKKW